MEQVEARVRTMPVTVKIHWPDLYCKYCLQECQQVAPNIEMYWCPSCNKYSAGRTEYVGAIARCL